MTFFHIKSFDTIVFSGDTVKNSLFYFYGIRFDHIRCSNNYEYYLLKDGQKYILKLVFMDVDALVRSDLYRNLMVLSTDMSEIVPTRFGKYNMVIDDNSYVLLKVNISIDKVIDEGDIINFSLLMGQKSLISLKHSSEMIRLWEDKTDYFEMFVGQYDNLSLDIRYLYDYYIGLSEVAISLLKRVDVALEKVVFMHKRIKYNSDIFVLYDPTNIILDNVSRDFAEYCKDKIVNNVFVFDDFKKGFDFLIDNYNDALMFLARIFFPTYFYDGFEKFIKKNIDEKEFLRLFTYIEKYEEDIFLILDYVSNKYNLMIDY